MAASGFQVPGSGFQVPGSKFLYSTAKPGRESLGSHFSCGDVERRASLDTKRANGHEGKIRQGFAFQTSWPS